MREKPNLTAVSDDDLLRRLSELLGQSRRIEADLIAHIAEVDARRLYAREATSSMFAYCTERLHLSEPEAALRIRVARVSQKHPVVLTMLRGGRIHLSGIGLLAPLLTVENRRRLLGRAAHKSKRQIEELVAELRPVPDAPTVVRKLPARRGEVSGPASQGVGPNTSGLAGSLMHPDSLGPSAVQQPAGPAAPGTEPSRDVSVPLADEWGPGPGVPVTPRQVMLSGGRQRPDAVAATESCQAPQPVRGGSTCSPQPRRAATVEPLAPARYKVQFTASAELRDKLERLQALMRSSVPGGDLGQIIDVAVTRELERLEAKRFAKTKKPRKSLAETDTTPRSRHIPAPVRRAVHERDGGRCTYRDRHGRRCTKRHDLEFHHREPFGQGGDHCTETISLMCRTHNTLMAEDDYGKEVMARFRRSSSSVSEAVAVYSVGSPAPEVDLQGKARKRTSSARVRAPAPRP